MFSRKDYKLFYGLVFSIIIGNYSSLVFSMQEAQSRDLFYLQAALNSLATKSDTGSKDLIGEFLIDKKFKDIFTEEQLENIIPKLNGNDWVLLKFDRIERIYQLKTLQQHGISCGAHAFKNNLWMINALNGSHANFSESYLKVLNENIFQEYWKFVECPETYISFDQQIENLIANKVSCINECLPRKSLEYLNQIFRFDYYPIYNKAVPGHGSFYWIPIFELAKNELTKIEPGPDIDDEAKDVAILAIAPLDNEEILRFYNLILKNDFIIGFDLGVTNGSFDHATCLVAHKVKNQLEYIFLDSLNFAFDRKYYHYLPLIQSVKRFIENPQELRRALIRRAYIGILYWVNQQKGKGALTVCRNFLRIFIADQFKDLNLVKSDVYQVYKPLLCELIKKYMAEDLENQNEYQKFLEKMDCL